MTDLAEIRMRTVSGWLHPFAPQPGELTIESIAKLAYQFRYKAQSLWTYSVAQHSVLIASLLPPEWQLEGLLHDASEAFLGDMISMLKHTPDLAGFRRVEDKLQNDIYDAFGVVRTAESSAAIHELDIRIRSNEIPALFDLSLTDSTAQSVIDRYGEPLALTIERWTPGYAEWRFLETYHEIAGRR